MASTAQDTDGYDRELDRRRRLREIDPVTGLFIPTVVLYDACGNALGFPPEALELTLTAPAGAGYGPTLALGGGPNGLLHHVTGRESATLAEMVTGRLIIAEVTPIDATTPDNVIRYRSGLTTWTGSATVANVKDNLKKCGSAVYTGTLYAVIQVVSGGGTGATTEIFLTVVAEQRNE
jgi:hypothetical protein